MRKQSTEGQESSIQRARALWREYLLPYRGTLAWAVVGGVVAAVASGFGIPVILQEMFPVIFDGKPLPPWAERVLLWYVSPENLPLVENDIWEPLNATNGRNMDQAISEALAKTPGVCKMEKKSYMAVTRKNAPQEINQAINQSASDGRSANLLDVAFSLAGAPALNADADAKAIEEARAKTGAEQISTMQVLENGQVVLIRLEGITPVKALPYETARNSARADLLESMTVESMNKAATELNTELQKAEKPVEQFNAIAGKAGAKTASYGPFVNPNVLLSSVNLQNAKTQEELQSLLERAMNSRLAPPKELPAPEEVFQAASVINPGQMAQPINTGDGILLTQLVKRELEDTPEFQIKSTQQIAPALTAQAKSMIMLDWLKACITQYKVEIAPILNQER